MGDGEPADDIGSLGGLGALGAQKLEARRHGEENVTHLDRRALAVRRGRTSLTHPALDGDGVGGLGAAGPRGDGEARHRADRRQRLAAKAEAADVDEIVVVELGGRMALDREAAVPRRSCRGRHR